MSDQYDVPAIDTVSAEEIRAELARGAPPDLHAAREMIRGALRSWTAAGERFVAELSRMSALAATGAPELQQSLERLADAFADVMPEGVEDVGTLVLDIGSFRDEAEQILDE